MGVFPKKSALSLIAIVYLLTLSLAGALPRNSTSLSCTRGMDKTDFSIQCTGSTPYITIRNIFYGALHITSPCNGDATYDACCGRGAGIPECVFRSNTDFTTISEKCVITQCEVGPGSSIRTYGRCDPENYPQLTSFMFVEYDCTATHPTTPRAPTTSLWATPTPWVLPTTTEYLTKLTPGGQAGVIIFIMLIIVGVAAGITVYKRWKYGAPENSWKFFSNPPELSVSQQDIPKVIPWVSGEAREQIYKTFKEFRRMNERPQQKRQMAAQDSLASDVILGLQEEVDGLKEALVESISVMIAALVLFPLVILAVYRLTHRIQAYAQTLQERTRDLDIERKRSETLLFELLPVSVAQKLLNHEDVPPVSYAAVTVFFSDIVGFTNICSRSTPMQVIDMLNSLYRIFDDIIDTYDVYKVETIGDAYMVASGLPQENKDGHATEMAAMALDVRDKLSQMTVQHLPGESLRMRIGLNSGPVVAGVVGHKMPRYCLFGDTVNVASRMESTSLPLKIQITDRTRRELERKGGYVITERGKVEIKGKGEMLTFWLDERSTAASDDAIAQH